MPETRDDGLEQIPEPQRTVLLGFVAAARTALASDLVSVVLFGSAAEGRLRPTSDINLLLVLKAFAPARMDALREPLRAAEAAVRLRPMFVLDGEVGAAVEAFAVKFADILRRRRVLAGEDPFAGLRPSRAALVTRINTLLLNLTLRLRESYMSIGAREEQAARAVAEHSGPLRACAAGLLELEGTPAPSPREALERVAAAAGPEWTPVLDAVRETRAGRDLAPGTAAPTLLRLADLATLMRARAGRLA